MSKRVFAWAEANGLQMGDKVLVIPSAKSRITEEAPKDVKNLPGTLVTIRGLNSHLVRSMSDYVEVESPYRKRDPFFVHYRYLLKVTHYKAIQRYVSEWQRGISLEDAKREVPYKPWKEWEEIPKAFKMNPDYKYQFGVEEKNKVIPLQKYKWLTL